MRIILARTTSKYGIVYRVARINSSRRSVFDRTISKGLFLGMGLSRLTVTLYATAAILLPQYVSVFMKWTT